MLIKRLQNIWKDHPKSHDSNPERTSSLISASASQASNHHALLVTSSHVDCLVDDVTSFIFDTEDTDKQSFHSPQSMQKELYQTREESWHTSANTCSPAQHSTGQILTAKNELQTQISKNAITVCVKYSK